MEEFSEGRKVILLEEKVQCGPLVSSPFDHQQPLILSDQLEASLVEVVWVCCSLIREVWEVVYLVTSHERTLLQLVKNVQGLLRCVAWQQALKLWGLVVDF